MLPYRSIFSIGYYFAYSMSYPYIPRRYYFQYVASHAPTYIAMHNLHNLSLYLFLKVVVKVIKQGIFHDFTTKFTNRLPSLYKKTIYHILIETYEIYYLINKIQNIIAYLRVFYISELRVTSIIEFLDAKKIFSK